MPANALDRLVFREVDHDRWPDQVRLFKARGGPKHCWCMVWRPTGPGPRPSQPARRKAILHASVEEGTPVGILGYLDGEPVAWCSIAPRETYRPLGGPEAPDEPGSVWSLVCFYVQQQLRGAGITHRLIEAAVAVAGRHGAAIVEAYPVDPGSPSYRFMGFVSTFAAAGFREVGRAGTRRHVMRVNLVAPSP